MIDNDLPPGFAGGFLTVLGVWAAGIILYGIIGVLR